MDMQAGQAGTLEPSLNELFGGQVVCVWIQGPSAVHFIVDYPLLGQAAHICI